MARRYSENEESTKISKEDKELRDKIVAIISKYTQEMEGYSLFGGNLGVKEYDYEEIADDILMQFNLQEKA